MPLRRAWYGLIILASLLPAIALSPWLSQQAHQLLLDHALLNEEMFHKEIEIHLHLETNRLISVLQNKSDPIAYFLRHERNIEAIRDFIEKISQRESMVNTSTIYDQDANIIVTSQLAEHTTAHISKDDPAFVIPMLKRVYIGSPRLLSDNHFEFIIAVPIISENRSMGVIVSTINIDEYWQNIRAKTSEHDSNVYIVDGRGSLLTHMAETKLKQGDLLSDKEIVRTLLAGKDWHETDAYEGFEGKQVFGIATLVRGLQWGLISEIESEEITSPILSALIMLTVIVVLLHAIFGLLSLMFTKRLLNPISDLAAVVKRATEGDYSYEVSPSPYIEIDDLGRSFNIMIREIENRESSLRKLSEAIEQGGESVVITDKQGIIEYVNPAFTQITGYSSDEVVGKNPRLLNSGNQAPEYYEKLWKTISSGKVWYSPVVDRRKDGSDFPALMTISPIIDAKGEITHYVAIQQDMSSHEILENKFRQAQKMEALGTLVGGIAHDFNNMLAGMTGNLYLAKRKTNDLDVIKKLSAVENLSFRASEMIQQLLIFARKGHVQMKSFGLTTFIKEVVKLCETAVPENILFKKELCSENLLIHGDATQLQQVLINLVNNARDALTGVAEPVITLKLENIEVDESFIKRHPDMKVSQFARMTVQDNGIGIDAKDLEHIFEPFFTTKEAGQGTGLGLAMSYGSIQNHGGIIEIESSLNQGATFQVYLPLLQEAHIITPELPFEDTVKGYGETILLVDDNVDMRTSSKEVLESLNYKVLEAGDGLEAVDMFASHQADISLIVMDVVMPRLGGVEAVKRISAVKPDVKVIYCTGYDRGEMVKNASLLDGESMISKPYKIPAFSRAVRNKIDS